MKALRQKTGKWTTKNWLLLVSQTSMTFYYPPLLAAIRNRDFLVCLNSISETAFLSAT